MGYVIVIEFQMWNLFIVNCNIYSVGIKTSVNAQKYCTEENDPQFFAYNF